MKYRLLLLVLILFCSTIVHAQTARYARVISQNANLRDAPSITSVTATEVVEETLVKVLDEKLPWYVVRIGNRVGWMHGDTLEFINTQSPVTSAQSEQTVTPIYTPPSSTRRSTSGSTSSRSSSSGSSSSGSSSSGRSSSSRSSSGSSSGSSSTSGGYIRGPRGGCYYISASGRKVYVDRSMCN